MTVGEWISYVNTEIPTIASRGGLSNPVVEEDPCLRDLRNTVRVHWEKVEEKLIALRSWHCPVLPNDEMTFKSEYAKLEEEQGDFRQASMDLTGTLNDIGNTQEAAVVGRELSRLQG